MEKNNVVITVLGETGTGKSTLVLLLEDFLQEQGFDVEIDLENERLDYGTEVQFRAVCSLDWKKRLKAIKGKTKITLKSMQAKRGSTQKKNT
jgi:ABC-type nitrate/sulfonate/bicarbonate transport system ATPase subunit